MHMEHKKTECPMGRVIVVVVVVVVRLCVNDVCVVVRCLCLCIDVVVGFILFVAVFATRCFLFNVVCM